MSERDLFVEDIVFENNEPSGLTARDNIVINGNAIVRNSKLRGISAQDQLTIVGTSHEISGNGGDGITCFNGPIIVRGELLLMNNGANTAALDIDADAGDGLFGPSVILDGVTSQGNRNNGLSAQGGGIVIRGRARLIANGQHGLAARGPVVLSGGRISDNGGYGVFAPSVRLSGTQISNNAMGGIAGKTVGGSGSGRVLARTSAGFPAFPLSVVRGSSITGNGGDGISFDGTRSVAVNGNNISGNAGFGVKVTGGGTVVANNNWWGSPSGPGAAISGSVVATVWQSSAVGVYAGVNEDSVFVRPGDSLSIPVVLANWSAPSDSFTVDASDGLGWLTPVVGRVVALRDSTPSVTSLLLMVPPGAVAGDTSRAVLSASSIGGSGTATDTFTIVVYTPGLRHVAILNDTARVNPGDTTRIFVVGLDQAGREVPMNPVWSAQGGTIDPSGRFVAGDSVGTFLVRVADSATGYTDSTVVVILPGQAPAAPGSISISASTVDLGAVLAGQQKVTEITITNTAGSILRVDSVRTRTPFFAAVREPDVTQLRVGDTLSVLITFSPDTARVYYDTLLVYHSDSATSPRRIALMGNGSTTDVTEAPAVPQAYELSQNYPNPFNPSTTIRYALPVASRVRLTVHDILGREVARLADEVHAAGFVTATWAPQVASGTYLLRMDATAIGDPGRRFVEVRRMVLVK